MSDNEVLSKTHGKLSLCKHSATGIMRMSLLIVLMQLYICLFKIYMYIIA